jgi:trehalose-6-phosphatase
MKHPGSDEWENLAETFDMGWQAEVIAVFQKYTDKVQGMLANELATQHMLTYSQVLSSSESDAL